MTTHQLDHADDVDVSAESFPASDPPWTPTRGAGAPAGRQKIDNQPASAERKAPFSEEEWADIRAEDLQAARTFFTLIISIFTLGLIGYSTIFSRILSTIL